MVRINIYITKGQVAQLKKLAENGLSISEHIRRAIDLYLAQLERKGNPDE